MEFLETLLFAKAKSPRKLRATVFTFYFGSGFADNTCIRFGMCFVTMKIGTPHVFLPLFLLVFDLRYLFFNHTLDKFIRVLKIHVVNLSKIENKSKKSQ